MGDEKFAEIRPRDLAVVWGRAFGQLVDLWTSGYKSLIETGSGENPAIGDEGGRFVSSAVSSAASGLEARNMKGDSFGEVLPDGAVTVHEIGPAGPPHGPDAMLMNCKVNESLVWPRPGDIYRGQVFDAHEKVIAEISVDAGS